MQVAEDRLWAVTFGQSQIDPVTLAAALEEAASAGVELLDFRTRLLIRESLESLRGYWGERRFEQWLANSGYADALSRIQRGDFDEHGLQKQMQRATEAVDVVDEIPIELRSDHELLG